MKKIIENSRTGDVVGKVEGDKVTTIFGDIYEVTAGDINWLLHKDDIQVGDIKAVGFLKGQNVFDITYTGIAGLSHVAVVAFNKTWARRLFVGEYNKSVKVLKIEHRK